MAKQEVEWMAAALEWCRICRPDILQQVKEMLGGRDDGSKAFALLLGIGFDAGRCFQSANSNCPLGPIMPGGEWSTITAAVRESRGEPPERPCDCGHARDQHDERGACDECDCAGFAPW